jgi:DNA polymerase-3 subunit delta'
VTGRTNAFVGIVGQERATDALREAIDSARLFPSLVFHGPARVGKLSTAFALCRALLCPAPGVLPHDTCTVCRRIQERSLMHPDVRVVLPEKLSDFEKGDDGDDGPGADVQERQDEAVANPVWTILVDRIRQCLGFVHRRPSEGSRSVLIIDQAHRMGGESANALLKTLEEPPEHAILVLLTNSYHSLLPTIRSRCRPLPFTMVPTPRIAAWLIDHGRMDRDEAVLRAALCGGRIGVALDLDLEDYRAQREVLVTLLETLVTSADPGIAVARAEELARGGEALEGALEILMTLLRDLMLLEAAGSGAPIMNLDLAPRLEALARHAPPRGPQPLLALEEAIEGIRRKGNRQLLVENALLGLVPAARAARPAPPG